jgi:tRNA G10  N-methylase Trm11
MSQRRSDYPRRLGDDYPTPPFPSQAVAPHLPPRIKLAIDPAVGAGGMVDAFNKIGLPMIGTAGDFLKMIALPHPSINAIITNPPYGKSGKLARRRVAASDVSVALPGLEQFLPESLAKDR